MLSLINPKDINNCKIIIQRQTLIIDLIKTYKSLLPLEIINEYNINKKELRHVKGALLTPRNSKC